MRTPTGKSVVTFFILTTILALPAYILIALTSNGIILSPDMAFSFVPLVTLAPLIAALILTYQNGGWADTKALLGRTFDFKRVKNKLWLIVAVALPPLIVIAAWFMATLLGLEFLPAQMPLIAIPIAISMFFVGALFEEIGWMGYAYGQMEGKWGAFKATAILGVIISLFHVPLYYYLIEDPIMLTIQILFPVSLRFLVVWIYKNSGASIFAATIFHTMYNTSYSVFSVNLPVATGLSIAVAAALVYFWTPRTLTDFRSHTRIN